jgi:hypothetical protein
MLKNILKISWRSTKSKLFLILPPGLLIAGNIFIFGAATIYRGNSTEFSVSFIDILKYYAYPFVSALIAFLLIGLLFSRKYLFMYISLLFILGLLLWIEGNFLVWDYGVFDGRGIEWSKYNWQGWVDASLWIILIIVAFILHRKIPKISSFICLGLIFLQSLFLLSTYVSAPQTWSSDFTQRRGIPKSLFNYSSSFNIIHLLADGFQADVFQEIVKENGMDSDLDGFVLFKENMGAFSITSLTLPAIFSGEIYSGRTEMGSFIKRTLSEKGFQNVLYNKGYDVNIVAGITMPVRNFTNYYRVPRAYGGSWKDNVLSEATFLMDLVLFRHLPHFIKKEVYNDQNWTTLNLFKIDKEVKRGYFHCKEFFQDYIEFLKIKSSKPAYHFIHLLPPHPPFVTDENCKYSGRILPPTIKNYKIEAKCILLLFIRFINKLKKLGIYDSSCIIFQADTGQGWPVNMKNKPLSDKDMKNVTPGIAGRSLALLAVKRPNNRGAMKISSAKTTVADIPSTVMKIAGLQNHFKGTSVFEIDPLKDRERLFDNRFKVTGSVYDYKSWQKIDKAALLRRQKADTYKWGSTIQFGFLGNAELYQTRGWSFPEDGFTWTDGHRASLVIPITNPESEVILRINLRALLHQEKIEKQTVHVLVNGQNAGKWMITKPGFHEHRVTIPETYFTNPDYMEITFNIPDATSPEQLEVSKDKRCLGIAVRTVELSRIE